MTECGPLISYSLVSSDDPPLGSVGKRHPLPRVQDRRHGPEHGVGEVLVRGENVMLGLLQGPRGHRATIDEEGWLHTGDLGHLDADGNLFLTGRSKNMILSASGQNVYPEEVEAKFNTMPYVSESLIMDCNGKICALVHPDMDRADEERLSRVADRGDHRDRTGRS